MPSARRVRAQPLQRLVTNVVRDTVMAQVEMQCGPHRVVALINREAADELRFEPGVPAVASMKATNDAAAFAGATLVLEDGLVAAQYPAP